MENIEIKEFLSIRDKMLLIDVRSPMEYADGHIKGAENFYLFDDEERKEIGTLYKQEGKDIAVMRGLEIIGPRMASYVNNIKSIYKGREIAVYCARGGMRSGSISWLLETAGFKVFRLIGGYKSYRNYMNMTIANLDAKIILLGGSTGSGKTEVLRCLEEKGEQIIDLEKLASHRGSAFGALGQEKQSSTEDFMNRLFEKILSFDMSKRIWVENESKLIGQIFIPDSFWRLMKSAPIIELSIPKNLRIKRILREYGSFEIDELKSAVNRIGKRLGLDRLKIANEALNKGDLALVVDLSLSYYDKAYNMSTSKYKDGEKYTTHFDIDNSEIIAEKLLDFCKEYNL